MAGARELGEVHGYPLESSESGFDDGGYVLMAAQDGNGTVRSVDTSTDSDSSGTADDLEGQYPVAGVLYASTLDQDDNVRYPPSGEVDVAGESGGIPIKADADTYNVGDDVYLSGANAGHVNKSDTSHTRVGSVAAPTTVDNAGEKVIVKFTTA